jgi:transposase
MIIIGCDFHTRYQQIAMLHTETGEVVERRWEHENGEARRFYGQLPKPVRVGIEATGFMQWFEQLLAELGHELWVWKCRRDSRLGGAQAEDGHAGRGSSFGVVGAGAVSADLDAHTGGTRCAAAGAASCEVGADAHQGDESTARVGDGTRPVPEEKVVEHGGSSRTGSSAVRAVGQSSATGVVATAGSVAGFAGGVGPCRTATSGRQQRNRSADDPSRRGAGNLAGVHADVGSQQPFPEGQTSGQLSGTKSAREVFGGQQHMGPISKQGNSMMRWLLVEAGQTAARLDPELRRTYQRLKFRRGSSVAKVAIARKLAVRLYWMLRSQADYAHLVRHAG